MMTIFKFGEVDGYGIPSGRYWNLKCDLSGWFEGPPFFGGPSCRGLWRSIRMIHIFK